MSTTRRGAEGVTDLKAFLFCPGCERSAPIGDGWPVTRHNGRTETKCPNCETILLSQPNFESKRQTPALCV